MKIISIGEPIEHPNVSLEYYSSSVSLLDYDILIWNPSDLFLEYEQDYVRPKFQGKRCLKEDSSFKIIEDIKRRNNEIREMINLGRIVVIIMPPSESCFYYTGEKQVVS